VRIVIPREELEYKYIKQELSIIKIARLYGCNRWDIDNLLRSFCIRKRSRGEASKIVNSFYIKLVDKEDLFRRYIEDRTPVVELAGYYGCSCGTIYKALKRYGIPVLGRSIFMKGRNKHNNAGIARAATKRGGLTKENTPWLAERAKKIKGRTKENYPYLQRMSDKRLGKTKENCEFIARAAEKKRGRTKFNHSGVLSHSIKMAAMTKENCGHLAERSRLYTGRTKETHEYIARAAETKRKLNKHNCEGIARQAEKISVIMTGSGHWNWNGGSSFEPYLPQFNRYLRECIRARDNYRCIECGKAEEKNGRRLDVHHIDYNKHNLYHANLISLCMPCHMKTNTHREFWQAYYQSKVLSSEPIKEVQIC